MGRRKLDELLMDIAGAVGSKKTSDERKTSFNIFRVLQVETKEVIICRLLRELLDPVGRHDMGHYPLYRFAKDILEISDFTEFDAIGSKVITEDPIDERRRVDIVIQTPKGVLPIEVKIWAKDQGAQLWDYYHYYNKQKRLYAEKIYYLTPTGWEPSEKSRGQLVVNEDVKLLSFVENIKSWLMECLGKSSDAAVRMCVGQLVEVIDVMTKEVEEMKILTECLCSDSAWDLEKASAVLLMLKHGDEIHREILKSFLKKNVKYDCDVSVIDCVDADLNVDKHALVRLVRNGEAVACICVDTNLYLFCRKQEGEGVSNRWTNYENGQYRWTYLSPTSQNTYPLKKITELKEITIKIAEVLNEIILELP